ncbi:Ste24 endopeptidase [Catellatospora methionotrophica]|uniref:Ste24 endopeptidase n=1 Tax=Catellatospora methionotrophica TaxID=121620 RepID=A0A8J3PDF7_9ACTN|nr:M48 family metallopeptidase [Catellatospora methionotrophica]GIG13037.1 Ste24 endopeptidase [Catellatospora methionotrophica]
MTVRGWAWLTLVVLCAALAVTVAVLVPWHRPPAPRADQLAALAELPADRVAKARELRGELRWITYPAMLLGLAVALVLGLTPLGSWLVGLVPGPWAAKVLGGGLLVLGVADLITLPFAAWRHTVAVRYGLSTQDWGGWAVDLLKGYAVGAVLGAIALLGFFGLTRLAPNWWWAFGAVGAAALVVLLSFVFPVLIEPVFNKFTPMADGPLRTELMELAQRDGVPVRDVLVADASRRTTALNAYVSGIGPTRRIVVYDTLLREAPQSEIVAVAAHELGHAERGDVVIGTVIGALGTSIFVVGLYLLGGWGWLLRRAGVDSIAEPRAIGLLLAVATFGGLLAGPAQAYVSRLLEARADEHALELTGDPAGFEQMQGRLSLVNLGDPDPPAWEQGLFGSHPTTVERMAAARAYARDH